MAVHVVGIKTFANFVQMEKTIGPMVVTDDGMATLTNEVHPDNAPSSRVVTEGGIEI